MLLFQKKFNLCGPRAPHAIVFQHDYIVRAAASYAQYDIETNPRERHAARQTLSRASAFGQEA